MNPFIRSELLFGTEAVQDLKQRHVMIFGVGGVGGYVVEALARANIGHLTLVDFDTVSESNINRQLCALTTTVGQEKTAVFAQRLKEINPEMQVTTYHQKVTPNDLSILEQPCDYVVDAIDDVEAKVALLAYCVQHQIPVVSSMGAANHWDPSKVKVADISKTEYCPLAKIVRTKLKKLEIRHGIKTVFTCEEVRPKHPVPELDQAPCEGKRPEGTVSYMPAIFGLHCAATVIRDLLHLDA